MKTTIFILVFMFLCGCQQQVPTESEQISDTGILSKVNSNCMATIYDRVGPLHNSGLDYIIPKLITMRPYLINKPSIDVVNYINGELDVFWNNSFPNIPPIDNVKLDNRMMSILINIGNETTTQACQYAEKISDSLITMVTDNRVRADTLRDVSVLRLEKIKRFQKFISYNVGNQLKQLKSKVRSYSTFQPTYYDILNLNTSANTIEPNPDNYLLYSSTSMSYYSSYYWENFHTNNNNTSLNKTTAGAWGVVGAIDLAAALMAEIWYFWDVIVEGMEFNYWNYLKTVTKAATAASATAAIRVLWGKW